MKKSETEIVINHKRVNVSNLEKVFWPDEGYTKGDLIDYYRSIAQYILPYLKNRPESLHRFPNGIYSSRFYQKNVEVHPEWVQTSPIYSESTDETVNFVIANDEATLVYLANLGAVEMNVWNSRIQKLEYPDYMVIDLDPEGIGFDAVVESALEVKKVLSQFEIESYPKTSGATGMHIFVPTGAKYSYEQVKQFAQIVVNLVHQKIPELTSLERRPEKQQHKVYLDYLQNNYQATMASAYSVRPKPGATVSMPLEWTEVKPGLTPKQFDIKNSLTRIEKRGEIFAPVLGKGIDIAKALDKLK
jgi:bifunctional non-homologous end joining protein LigD